MAELWAAYRYQRTHLPSGHRSIAERGFIGLTDFLGHLALWNRQQPRTWAYEPVDLTPSGWVRDTTTVRHIQ